MRPPQFYSYFTDEEMEILNLAVTEKLSDFGKLL